MSQEPQQYLGVTAPISLTLPTEHELKLSDDLLQTLKDFGLFESEQEAQKRLKNSVNLERNRDTNNIS